MTESDWSRIDYHGVVAHARVTASARRVRLAACALCRNMFWCYLDRADRQAAERCVQAAEQFADGRVLHEELHRARGAAGTGPLLRAARAAASPDPEQVWEAFEHLLVPLYERYEGDRMTADGYAFDLVFELADLARDVFGSPFRSAGLRPEWRTDAAVAIACGVYDADDFSALPILADALQDAGCDDEWLLDHCRGPGPHARGCWAVDLVLGKE